MTYEQALKAWALARFPDIPEDAYGFEVTSEYEVSADCPTCGYDARGYLELSYRVPDLTRGAGYQPLCRELSEEFGELVQQVAKHRHD